MRLCLRLLLPLHIMNPVAIFGVIIGLIVAFYGLTADEGGLFGGGKGPLATGPRSAEVRNPQPIQIQGGGGSGGSPSSGGGSRREPELKPGESPYKGVIRIGSVERFGDRPENEYLTLRYSGGSFESNRLQPIDITGWRIATRRESEAIPRAFNIPEIDAVEQDIWLPAGGELVIVTGAASYTKNFRENQCVGYFNESHLFTPFLSNSCPDDIINRSDLLARRFNGACIDAIEAVPACRQPAGPFLAGVIGGECIDYMRQNFSYYGCVKNFRDKKNFLKNTWRVSLRRSRKMFDSRHDRVILRDAQGLLVDEFEY